MCGIIGYTGKNMAISLLLEGLKRLEYRGYDSAGIAILTGNTIRVVRKKGKIRALEKFLNGKELEGTVGLGHTRWATHGKPADENAHPHSNNSVAIVHNGIIENYRELRKELEARGYHFSSETDTEVMLHLVDEGLKQGKGFLEAVRGGLKKIRGTYAFGILSVSQGNAVIGARRGSPLIVGISPHGNFIASDIPALLPYTRQVIPLEEGDIAFLLPDKVTIYDEAGNEVQRSVLHIPWDPVSAEKGEYKHFMQKEIFEQPRGVTDTLRGRIRPEEFSVYLEEIPDALLKETKAVQFIACGTSYHAALVGKYWLDQIVGLPATAEVASEFRIRHGKLPPGTLTVAISQSGETTDTLAAAERVKSHNGTLLSITNVLGNSLARLSDGVLYTRAGPEIGVAATKTFSAQLSALFLLALKLAAFHPSSTLQQEKHLPDALLQIPRLMEEVLSPSSQESIRQIARRYARKQNALYLGRGLSFPIALEGALKLKEISYIHAEGYAAGEMKHGPIALVDEDMLVVFVAPLDPLFPKVTGNIQEVAARNGEILLITSADNDYTEGVKTSFLVPQTHPFLYPFLSILPLQLLAYYIAVERGYDVDQPRNLAKTVTVE